MLDRLLNSTTEYYQDREYFVMYPSKFQILFGIHY